MARREHHQYRPAPRRREKRPRVLIYCGATGTEPVYFEGFRQASHRRLPVVLEVREQGVDPARLVAKAVAFAAAERDRFEEIWCVTDVDEFDRAASAGQSSRLASARRGAEAAGVQLAISNPCFELWLLLHLRDQRSWIAGKKELKAAIQVHLPHYDRESQLRFDDFAGGIAPAIVRARRLDDGDPPRHANPSTGVWRLVDRISGSDPGGT